MNKLKPLTSLVDASTNLRIGIDASLRHMVLAMILFFCKTIVSVQGQCCTLPSD